MSSNSNELWEQAVELFGSDAGVIVTSLHAISINANWRTFHADEVKWGGLDRFERWLLINVGLPEWVAPHLGIEFCFDDRSGAVLIGCQDEESRVYLCCNGRVIWVRDQREDVLNETYLGFVKSLILIGLLTTQVQLVVNSEAYFEKTIPQYLKSAFLASIEAIAPGYSSIWNVFANLDNARIEKE